MNTIFSQRMAKRRRERALVDRARQGDADAFSELVRECYPVLLRVVRNVVKDSTDAEDVVQDALSSAYLHLQDFRHEAPFSTWLTRIAINHGLNMRRRKRFEDVNFDEELCFSESPTCVRSEEDKSPEQACIFRETESILRGSIDRIPAQYRAVLSLKFDDLTNQEIAAKLGLSRGVVKLRVHRARRALRSVLLSQMPGLLPSLG